MRTNFLKPALVLLTFSFYLLPAFAQSPEKMSYQAVIRNASGQLVVNSQIGMQVSILQGSVSGSEVYKELHNPNPQTNANGLVTIEIGSGIPLIGSFAAIDWSAGPYFIKTETDPTGGTNYTIAGTSQLLSVPYALHAKTADNGITTAQANEIAANTLKTGITVQQASDITANNAKVGITTQQASDITANNAKVGITTAQATAITANTAKVGITPAQATAITANTAKVGITPAQANEIAANTAKVGITGAQTAKLAGIADGAEVNVQADWNQATTTADDFIKNKPNIPAAADGSETKVTAGTNVTVTGAGTTASPYEVNATGQTPGTAAGQMQYWNGSAWVIVAATPNEGAALQMIGGIPTWVGGTDPTPIVTNPTTSKIWMDRNLGASQVATSSTDAASYGDLYQWGRGTDGHQIRTSVTTTTLSTTDAPGHGNFIITSSGNYDWRSPQNDSLWQGVSGTNNPCPSGYRLPTEAEWNAERLSWGSNSSTGAFASPLKLPVAGRRYSSTGSLNSVGSNGQYWSSTVSGSNAGTLSFGSSSAYMHFSSRTSGFSVRCIKD